VKNIYSLLLLMMSFTGLFSQNNNPFFELNSDSTVKWGGGMFANYNAGSNAITNGFMNSFYTGQYIDSTQKSRVRNKLNNNNRMGGDANAGIFYMQKLDSIFHKKVFAWFVSVKTMQHVNMAFSRDLFNVAFYGNDGYKGQTADFSGFNLYLIQYQQFQAGLISDRFGVGLSVYNGQQFQMLQAKTATMYTSTFGDYIDFKTSYNMIASDASHSTPGSSNGLGAGLDLYARMPLQLGNGQKGDLLVELSDFGFIRWNSQTNHYKGDTTFHFDGIVVKNAFQLADSSVHYSAKNVINAKPFQQTSYSSPLPATLDVKFVPAGSTYQGVLGIRYRFESDYIPYAYGQFRYHFGKIYTVSAELGYGGYANFQTGLSFNAKFRKGLSAHLGMNNLLGYIIPQYTCGQGLFVSVSKIFR
jgi:hypothetical protein